jgi:hypothetical protein
MEDPIFLNSQKIQTHWQLIPHSAPQNDCFVELFRARIGENETGTRQKSLHKLDMRPPQV